MANFKKPKHRNEIRATKKPNDGNEALSYYSKNASFSFCKYDANKQWSTAVDGKPSIDKMFHYFQNHESMKWGEIIKAVGARGQGNNSHYIPIEKLSKIARDRIAEIGIEESELFSLHLEGKLRLWGIIEQFNGCFYVIWFDPEHQIYSVKR